MCYIFNIWFFCFDSNQLVSIMNYYSVYMYMHILLSYQLLLMILLNYIILILLQLQWR
jgi:hypothetical protein